MEVLDCCPKACAGPTSRWKDYDKHNLDVDARRRVSLKAHDMKRRDYSALQRKLRDHWFALVETPDDWIDRGPMNDGESQSIRVENAATGMMGVAKPGPAKARRKIIAGPHTKSWPSIWPTWLSLSVAPVVLWGADAPAAYKRGRSISAWAFQQSMKWDEANNKGIITPTLRESAGPLVSAMRVFHTWIADTDRKSDHVQVNVDSPPTSLEIAFIDHGHSLSYVWKSANHPTPAQAAYMPAPEHRDVMIETAEYIASIADDDVSRVVNRIEVTLLATGAEGAHTWEPVGPQREPSGHPGNLDLGAATWPTKSWRFMQVA